MAKLPHGSEFLQIVKDAFPDDAWDTELSQIIFGYEADYENYLSAYQTDQKIPFGDNDDDYIYGLKSQDGKSLLILCNEDIEAKSCDSMFCNMTSLKEVLFNNFHTEECTGMSRMFFGCSNLLRVNTGHLKTPEVGSFMEMFSGCSSLSRLDFSNMTVDSNNVYDMLYGLDNLRILVLGENFGYLKKMHLQNPKSECIPHTNGFWNNLLTGDAYNVNSIPAYTHATYYAIDVRDEKYEEQVVTLGVIADMVTQLSNSFVDVLRMINTK